MYLQFISTLSQSYSKQFAKIEEKRNRLEKVLAKMETISTQVDELHQELSDLQPRLEQINCDIESKREMISQLVAQKTAGLSSYKQEEAKLATLKENLDKLQDELDSKMAADNDRISSQFTSFNRFLQALTFMVVGLNMSLTSIKGTDIAVMKTLKTPLTCVKLAFAAMCVLLGVGPDRVSDALAKKNVSTYAFYSNISNMFPSATFWY